LQRSFVPTNELDQKIMLKIAEAILIALNDYTINERGDVGSLVRLKALDLVEDAGAMDILFGRAFDISEINVAAINSLSLHISNAVMRLSLERLDKVRTRAALCRNYKVIDHSSYEYFRYVLDGFHRHPYFRAGHANEVINEFMQSVLEGYCSSAGMGSEAVVRASRSALQDYLDSLVIDNTIPEVQKPTLAQVCSSLCDIVRNFLDNDRVLVPVLEVIGFLLDVGIIQRFSDEQFKYVFDVCSSFHFLTRPTDTVLSSP
jgi:hypothetical protein